LPLKRIREENNDENELGDEGEDSIDRDNLKIN
jgi:hypothetical protein